MKAKTSKTSIQLQKEKLQKELNKLKNQEHEATVSDWLPKFKKKYEGKFYRTRNTYGGNSKSWWLYTAVKFIGKEDVYDTGGNGVTSRFHGWRFQMTPDGIITFDTNYEGYVHILGKEITEMEFGKQFRALRDKIANL